MTKCHAVPAKTIKLSYGSGPLRSPAGCTSSVLCRRRRHARCKGFACSGTITYRRGDPCGRPPVTCPASCTAGGSTHAARDSPAFCFLRGGCRKQNKCIRQCLHWLMQATPWPADMIRIPQRGKKARPPSGVGLFWHAVRDSNP